MNLTVPSAWIGGGATLEFELPRNLACAACGGGGCDACERSGAVTLRGRKDLAELIEVTLPHPDSAQGAELGVVMRIPGRGGLPEDGSDLPRGNLLLTVRAGDEPTKGVRCLAQPSIPPPPPVDVPPSSPGAPAPSGAPAFVWVVAAVVVALLAAWLLLH